MSHYNTQKNVHSQLTPENFAGAYPIEKYRGETLAVLLDRFRQIYTLTHGTKLTYAGRLDPMAEGLVLILAGESRFQKDEMLNLTKTYEVDILLGVATDTGDVLGMINDTSIRNINTSVIRKVIASMTSITSLSYPMYSSVPVLGKPLFVHAREGTIVDKPQKKVTIYSAEILTIHKVSLGPLAQQAIADIEKVVGDFRQSESIKDWEKLLTEKNECTIVCIVVSVSSGTYMRSLAEWLGEKLQMPAIAYRIVRTRVGEHTLHKKSSADQIF